MSRPAERSSLSAGNDQWHGEDHFGSHEAPAVNSFVSLAGQGYFDNTGCHRLASSRGFLFCSAVTRPVPGKVAQATSLRTRPTVPSYTEGTVAMANGGPGTNGSQFFLVWADSTSLDADLNFTIFGTMDKASRDVVASMAEEGQDGSNSDGTGRRTTPLRSRR